jgi:hypothetical protein
MAGGYVRAYEAVVRRQSVALRPSVESIDALDEL